MRLTKFFFLAILTAVLNGCSKDDEVNEWIEDFDFNMDMADIDGTWIIAEYNNGEEWTTNLPEEYRGATFCFSIDTIPTTRSLKDSIPVNHYTGLFTLNTSKQKEYIRAPFQANSDKGVHPYIAVGKNNYLLLRIGVTNIIDNKMSAYSTNDKMPWSFNLKQGNLIKLRFKKLE